MKTYQKYPILLFCENSNKNKCSLQSISRYNNKPQTLWIRQETTFSTLFNKIFNKEKNEEKEGQDWHFYALKLIINDVILNFTKSQK